MAGEDLDLQAALAPVSTLPIPEAQAPALPSLGSFDGEGHAPEPADEAEYGTIAYFGEDIRVALDPLSLELSFEEFMDLASGLEGAEDPRAFGVVRTFLRAIVHPDDFSKFWRLVKANRQDTMKQVEFGKYVVEQVSGHPTEQRSDSARGPLRTPPNSGDDVSSRVQARLEGEGRPDLALVVLHRREAVHSVG